MINLSNIFQYIFSFLGWNKTVVTKQKQFVLGFLRGMSLPYEQQRCASNSHHMTGKDLLLYIHSREWLLRICML